MPIILPALPYVVSLIPFKNTKHTICFTCSALLLILAFRVTKIGVKKLGVVIHFKSKD